LIFLSCRESRKYDTFKGSQIILADGEQLLSKETTDSIVSPYQMYYIDSCLILRDPGNFYEFKLINLRWTDSLITFGKKGQGSNEIMHSFQLMGINKESMQFQVLDFEKQNINYFHLDSILAGKTISDNYLHINAGTEMFYRMYPFSDKEYLCTGSSQTMMFCYFNQFTDSILWQIEYPNEENEKLPSEILPLLYQGNYQISGDGKNLVFACSGTPYIGFYLNNAGIINEISHKRYAEVHINPIVSEAQTTYDPYMDTKVGFVGVQMTDDYVFALYSGREYGKYEVNQIGYGRNIYVYDFNGNDIAEIIFPEDISGFCISDDNNSLFAIERKRDIELGIVKFDISKHKFNK